MHITKAKAIVALASSATGAEHLAGSYAVSKGDVYSDNLIFTRERSEFVIDCDYYYFSDGSRLWINEHGEYGHD